MSAIGCGIIALAFVLAGNAQSVPYQRAFAQPRTVVEQRLKALQSSSAGRLPVLEGFVVPGDRRLERFHRGYYQCAIKVSPAPSGGSMVQVNATITAWYADPVAAKSGYQVLPSNGRLETDLLDRLQEALGGPTSATGTAPVARSEPTPGNLSHAASSPAASSPAAPLPGNSAPVAHPKTAGSPFHLGDPLSPGNMPSLANRNTTVDRHTEEETKEATSLEEILRNQVHPGNLVAVKGKDTPVLANPREDAKVLFLAAAEDEFEILDVNPNWVHVRISGLSRGWIRRSSLEMLTADSSPQSAELQTPSPPPPASTQPFHVENEQVASFPGDWAPLQGKTVRIVSLQKTTDNAVTASPQAKLAFAKSLFAREYADLAKTPTSIVGVVMIFDSEDGGMVAATRSALGQWKAGSLSDEAFWRRCFFDPPDAFGFGANQ
ncbi:MAG: hypothetical protein ACRD20_08685 [Terriglobales bacterium]